MKVKLISMTPNPMQVMYTAARTCYSEQSPIDIIQDVDNRLDPPQSCEKLVNQVLKSGHLSIAEHINFTFAIEGISRACSHQLVRHRHCTFSQQSQRYVEIKEDLSNLIVLYRNTLSPSLNIRHEAYKEACEIVNKYFIVDDRIGAIKYFMVLTDYLQAIQNGCLPEDARAILPNATKTNIVMTCNLRQLMHICDLRLCSRAQGEIRELFGKIKEEVKKQNIKLSELLQPQCDRLGFCPEHKSCGRKPMRGEN